LAGLNQLKLTAKDIVVVCLSGRGDKDMAAYMAAMEEESSK
jgi:tryptophan synthase beta chain